MSVSKLFWKLASPSRSSLSVTSVEVDPHRGEVGDHLARRRRGPASTVRRTSPWSRNASIERGRHRVHRVRTDQLLHVDRVAVRRVLHARARPQRTLYARALRPRARRSAARRIPPGTARTPASRWRSPPCRGAPAARSRSRARLLRGQRVETLVDLGVHAAHEERRDRGDAVDRLARLARGPRAPRGTRGSPGGAPRARRAA